jgi:RHS repeat-associated protein
MKHNTRHWAGITAAGILSLAGYASAATPGSEKYTYDASGNIIEKSIDGVVTKMSFDRSNRLTEFQTAGQAKQSTAYDAAGRPVATKDQDGQTTRSMSYGYGDKVLEALTRDCKAGFYYNAEGQLVGKKVGGSLSTYTWDGNVLAADGAESFSNEAHVTGGVPVLTSETGVVVSDYLGNTLALGDKQFGSTAYGEDLEYGRFTGKAYMNELEYYVFNHRFYSPKFSRWAVADPTGFPDGLNNCTYVNNKPLTLIDPSGLLETSIFDTAFEDKENAQAAVKKITVQSYVSWEKSTVNTDMKSISNVFTGGDGVSGPLPNYGDQTIADTYTWTNAGCTIKSVGRLDVDPPPHPNPRMCRVIECELEARAQFTYKIDNITYNNALLLKTCLKTFTQDEEY